MPKLKLIAEFDNCLIRFKRCVWYRTDWLC